MNTGKFRKYLNNKDLPVLSVVIVVYNASRVIEQTLLSVINQSYQNIELIVIDGGSSDGTVEIIKRLEKHISYWISETDNGVYDAMNKAIDLATGDWVYFLGAGDILVNVIDKVIPMFASNETVYYGNVYRNDLLKVYDGAYSSFRLSRLCICHQAIFYPVEVLKKYKFDTKYKVQADHNLNMLIHGDRKYKFKYIPVLIALYDGTGISSNTKDVLFFKDRLKIVKANFSLLVYWYAYVRSMVAKMLNRNHF